MSARPIGELIAPIIADALGIGNLQEFLDCLAVATPENKKWWIMEWWRCGTINGSEAALLIEHNSLEAA